MDKNQLRALLFVLLGRHKLLLKTEQITRKAGYEADLAALSIPHFHIQLQQQQLYFSTVTTSN